MVIDTFIEYSLAKLHLGLATAGLDSSDNECSALFCGEPVPTTEDIASMRKAALEGSSPSASRLRGVYSLLGEDSPAAWLFELCCLCLMHPEAAAITNDAFGCGTCLEACAILAGQEPDLTTLRDEYDRAILLLIAESSAGPFFRRRFAADDWLLCYIEGSDEPDSSLKPYSHLFKPGDELCELYIERSRAGCICGMLSGSASVIQISGSSGRGRKLLLSHACSEAGRSCLFVNAERLAALKDERRYGLLKRLRREVLLHGHVLCYYGIEDEKLWPLEDFLRECVEWMPQLDCPICLCTGSDVHIIEAYGGLVDKVALPTLTRSDHIALWEGYSSQYALKGVDCFSIGSKFKLSPAQICKAAARLAEEQRFGTLIDEKAVSEVCADVLPPAEGNIRRVEVSYTIDDLVLPDEQITTLYNICAHVAHRRLVYDDWGMEKRFSYGKNVSALFVGAPGTGKTMAVHVLSNMLHLPLYHVDLSQVVDKYVGETEKRLEEIFDIAGRSNTILFFDEADGIFGKRSEVKDAKDKYANTQASYILQRIERYDGVVILATNFKQNIDDAFMRRIKYLVEFHKPSEELRLRLWRGAFAPETPLQGVDFPYLARAFELTGGSIKNIAINAAFLAAQSGGPITMKHILLSLRDENKKSGKTMLMKDFAEYGILFKDS